MNARDEVLLAYGDMYDGETRAGELCPSCRGGATKERTLSVAQRDGILLWKCHRASCGFTGGSHSSRPDGGSSKTKIPGTRGVVGRAIQRSSSVVDQQTRQYLQLKYCITDHHIAAHEMGWDKETGGLVLPVKSYEGEPLGVVLRFLDGRVPKVKKHAEKGAMSWHVNHTRGGVIVVEDQLSAIRASDFLTSVALLGTHLNDERVDEIRKTGLTPVYLALDADAWDKAITYALRYRSRLPLKLVRLVKDIKNLNNQELTEVIDGM